MDVFWLIIFMVMIGAIIGGLTNSLAIKMLFRPYKEMRIGRFLVPFTPGVIPKRRHELAQQLGRLVIDYLVTADGIAKRLMSSTFIDGLTKWLQNEAKQLLVSKQTGEQLLEKQLGITGFKQSLTEKSKQLVANGYRRFFTKHRFHSLDELLPTSFKEKIDKQIPVLTDYILDRGEAYLQSSEGKEQLSIMIDRFLVQKGTIGNMISMFLGNDRLVDKVQPAVIKGLQDPETRRVVKQFIEQEWNKLKQKQLHVVEHYLNEKEVVSYIQQAIEENVPLFDWLDTPLNEWAPQYEGAVMEQVIPMTVDLVIGLIATHLETILGHVHLDDIVKEQVEAFSVERLEELVLSISKREFKMITYLGAFLGGFIGLLQGILLMIIR
ncbi:DUF445 domain-containing protein [Bacillus sp. JCM 19034]|uniref:DUF445 domain-containing protein n=1 Tax=Bacillus sp. JCM 19034 TaxID=1481928 RepID=UPI0007841F56|nr:DUF445 family protein [Bacillus sp. JCM 19034]